MIFLIINVAFIIIAIIGLFLIEKFDDGLFMGINDCIKIYFLVNLILIALCVNAIVFIINFMK